MTNFGYGMQYPLKTKNCIVKPNTYLKTRDLHYCFDTKHDVMTN